MRAVLVNDIIVTPSLLTILEPDGTEFTFRINDSDYVYMQSNYLGISHDAHDVMGLTEKKKRSYLYNAIREVIRSKRINLEECLIK